MRATRRSGALVARLAALVLILPSLGARPEAEVILQNEPPEVVRRLEAEGSIVLEEVGGSGPDSFIVALVLFERSRDRVVELLKQSDRQSEYRPEVRGVRTIERFDDGRIDEQRLRILFRTLVYRLRYREDRVASRFTWKLDETFDNDVARMEGFWEFYQFEAEPERTLGRFGSNVDVGRAVPRFVQNGLSRRTVLRYIKNIRQWIDSDGEWRP